MHISSKSIEIIRVFKRIQPEFYDNQPRLSKKEIALLINIFSYLFFKNQKNILTFANYKRSRVKRIKLTSKWGHYKTLSTKASFNSLALSYLDGVQDTQPIPRSFAVYMHSLVHLVDFHENNDVDHPFNSLLDHIIIFKNSELSLLQKEQIILHLCDFISDALRSEFKGLFKLKHTTKTRKLNQIYYCLKVIESISRSIGCSDRVIQKISETQERIKAKLKSSFTSNIDQVKVLFEYQLQEVVRSNNQDDNPEAFLSHEWSSILTELNSHPNLFNRELLE